MSDRLSLLNISKHNAGGFEQITLSADYTDRKALLTRFKGSRQWSVRGRSDDTQGRFALVVADNMSKAKALTAARWFIEFYHY